MRSSPSTSTAGSGLVFLIVSDPDRPGELAWPARAALEAADAVLHDHDVDPRAVALAPRGCLVEPAPADIARARKLAGEGWRVVWLASGDPAGSPEKFEAAMRLAAAGVTVRTIAGFVGAEPADLAATAAPHPFATPFNGLAG